MRAEYTPLARVVALVLSLAVLHPKAALAQITVSSSGGSFTGGAVTGATSFLDGANFQIKNTADSTKILQFDVSGVTTGNTVTPQWAGATGGGTLRIGPGTGPLPAYSFVLDTDTGFQNFAPGIIMVVDANEVGWISRGSLDGGTKTNFQLDGPSYLCWNATSVTSTVDTCVRRLAAGVVALSNGASGTGWIQAGGRSMLAADYTNATAGFTSTALSVTVITGRKYTFRATLFLADSTAADGAQIDFNGGTAAATNFRVHCILADLTATIQNSSQTVALVTAHSKATLSGTGQHEWECSGSFEPSGNGTFIIRGAQVAHTTGTLTINRGSYLWVEDMP